MSTLTSRNDLVKPSYSDPADIGIINSNMEIIDASLAKGNYIATVGPTIADDTTHGYSSGSLWFDTVATNFYICESATANAAVWVKIYPISNADTLDGLHADAFVKQTLADAKGDLIVASGPDVWTRFPVGVDSVPIRAYSGVTQGIGYYPERTDLFQNALINAGFQICQNGVIAVTSTTTPNNNDDTYVIDGWTLLSDGSGIASCRRGTGSGTSTAFNTFMTLECDVPAKRFGIIQFIENSWAQHLVGKTVSLQFKAKTAFGQTINNLRAAVLSWNSTADNLTSDVVNSWAAIPTLMLGWTSENVPSQLPLVADTWQKYKVENILIDTPSTTNIAVFIWIDDGDVTVDDQFSITDIQLNEGPICLPYSPRRFDEDLDLCLRFWESSYSYGVAPGTPNTAPGLTHAFAQSNTTLWYAGGNQFRVAKRAAVAPVLYSYNGTMGKVTDTLTNDVGILVTAGSVDTRQLRTASDASSVFIVGDLYRSHWVADGRL